MTKIDVFSGFLGAGKTTLIKKLLKEAYAGEKVVLVENEFGEIGIDGGFMQEAGIQVTEMNAGCICCSLTGDFRKALTQVKEQYDPDRILIEPSGVGKLSDVVAAVESVENSDMAINGLVTVVDAVKAKMYGRNFGEFFNNQVESAGCIILSRTAGMKSTKLEETVAYLRKKNADAVIITTPWDELEGAQILAALERKDTLAAAMEAMKEMLAEDHDEDEDECDDPNCSCHHHDGEEHEHHHHHHHHDEDEDECGCGDPNCHGHHADDVFVAWGLETARKFTEDELTNALEELDDCNKYGQVLRAKGIVDSAEGEWFHYDYTPGEYEIRRGAAGVTGRLCVIGSGLNEQALAELFN